MYTKEKFIINGWSKPIEGIRIAGNIYHINSNIDSELIPESEKLIVVLTHPNGFIKEMWQPFINEFLKHLEALKIKSFVSKIISIDIRNQGDSALLNEGRLLEPPFKWKYNEQDILAVIENLNIQERNIIGIGNSIGAVNLLSAEACQPGTFKGIVAMDPSMFLPHKENSPGVEEMFKSSGKRRSVWPNRKEAREHFESRYFYQVWDPLVLDEYLNHGLKTSSDSLEVTLKCSPKEEMKTFMDDYDFQHVIFDAIAKVQCPTLILAGEGPAGILNGKQLHAIVNKLPNATHNIIPDANHLLPFENPKDTATESAKFIASFTALNSQSTNSQRKPKHTSKL